MYWKTENRTSRGIASREFCYWKFERKSIFIISSPPFVGAIFACLSCYISKKKYILEIRDPYPRLFFELFDNNKSYTIWLLRLIEKFLYQKADQIIVTENFDRLPELVPFKNKTFLVRNGAIDHNNKDINNFEMRYHEIFNKIQIPNNKLINIVHLGRIGNFQDKNLLDEEINNFLINKNIYKIIFIGDRYNNINNKIINLGKIHPEYIPKILKYCHLGISYKRNTTSGLINIPVRIYEYLNENILVRTNKSECIKDFAIQNNCIQWISFADEDNIEKSIILSLNRYKLKKQNGKFFRADQIKSYLKENKNKFFL